MRNKKFLIVILFSILAFSGCNNKKEEAVLPTTEIIETTKAPEITEPEIIEPEIEKIVDVEPIEKIEEIDLKVVKPYEVGEIMVIMYHGVVESNPPSVYQRTVADFKSDLQTLYDEGFRLIKMQDLIDNNITVKAGYTPVVLTFDDGVKEIFSMEKVDGKLVPVKNCAIDILNTFCDENPDFGKAGVLYVNANPFEGESTLKESLQYLIAEGYEIGNHTYTHANLKNLSSEEIQKEIGLVEKMLRNEIPDLNIVGLSYPFGARPKEELRAFALNGTSENNTYSYKFAVREGQSGASAAPNRDTFDPLNLPRVRGNSGEDTDLGWHFERYKANPESRYISDGNPNTISVPNKYESNVNIDSLGEKELILYSLE